MAKAKATPSLIKYDHTPVPHKNMSTVTRKPYVRPGVVPPQTTPIPGVAKGKKY
jgi:hypothetical protein